MKALFALVTFFLLSAYTTAHAEGVTPFETACAKLARHTKRGDETRRLSALFELYWKHHLETSPEEATYDGYPGFNDRWTDLSKPAIARRKREIAAPLKALAGIDRARLSPGDQLNYDLLRYDLEEQTRLARFPSELLPINQLEGVTQDVSHLFLVAAPRTEKDYEDMLARLRAVPTLVDQTLALLDEGLQKGITPPKITLRDVPDQVKTQLDDNPATNPLLVAFRNMPDTIAASRQKMMKAQAADILKATVLPSFRKLYEYLVKTYIPGARETLGFDKLPDGKAWYAERAKASTTSHLTPKEIHEIGLSEVKRIRQQMDAVIKEAGFKGSFPDFLEFLRTDSRFFYKHPEDLVRGYRDIAKRIDPNLTRLFGKLPRLPYGVTPVPAYAEKSQPTAYYEPGSVVANRAGFFFCNTYDLATRPKWEMEALTLHEAVPGHHLQIALGLEQTNVPEFRKYAGYTAFVEGWGLYAEGLGHDLGLYEDPYSHFGQLTYDMWRAVRLVVDTGIHSQNWTRDQAIQFFKDNTPKTSHDIEVEVDRYIVWPGQALAYKIGQLTFQHLRDEAKRELGPRFDIRAFHDAALANGALPLSFLEQEVRHWIGAHSTESPR